MSDALNANANAAVDALRLPLSHTPLPADRVISGDSSTAATTLAEFKGNSIGIWEITPGVSTDVEAEEMFVVLEGRATITFESGEPPMELVPGSVARLAAGTKSVWTVSETLRKLYILPAQ